MSLQKIAEYLFPAGNFAQIRATSPDQRTYNIKATRDLVKNQPLIFAPFAPAAAATMSIPYDVTQGIMRARDKFFDANPTSFGITDDTEVPIGPSLSDVAAAIDAENPLDSLVQRTQGATLGLVDRLKNAPEFLSDLVFTRISADADKPPLNQFDNITNTGVAGINIDELDDDRSTLLDRKDGILNNVDLGTILSIAEIFSPTNLRKALAGTRLGSTVSNLFQGRRDGLGPRSGFLDRTPGYTGPLIASDQYDPITRTNRFDRAKTLFGQSRSLMEYIQKKKAEREAKKQTEFLANENRGGDGPMNNPQGGLGRQDYSRATNQAFQDLADELGIK